ncbi:hypothetical protein BGZ63DRAFT_369255 [Mariannaea sp. PMI_226]|nr:hypothetical protein BGZ63DRAFT_369255 [Mariannaea sp. PMI_226]
MSAFVCFELILSSNASVWYKHMRESTAAIPYFPLAAGCSADVPLRWIFVLWCGELLGTLIQARACACLRGEVRSERASRIRLSAFSVAAGFSSMSLPVPCYSTT